MSGPPRAQPEVPGSPHPRGPRWCHRPPAPSIRQGSRPPGPPRPPTGFPVPGPAPAAPPPGHTTLPASEADLARGSLPRSPPFPKSSEAGVDAPLTPDRQAVCPSASSQFPDPFASPSLRSRVARCRGPAPKPGPGLFTHSPSIPSRRDLPLGRLRAAAPPPRRGPAPRLHRRVRTAPPAPQVGPPELLSSHVCRLAPTPRTQESEVVQPEPDGFQGGAIRGQEELLGNFEETLISS